MQIYMTTIQCRCTYMYVYAQVAQVVATCRGYSPESTVCNCLREFGKIYMII